MRARLQWLTLQAFIYLGTRLFPVVHIYCPGPGPEGGDYVRGIAFASNEFYLGQFTHNMEDAAS